jgi:hypothetical protein
MKYKFKTPFFRPPQFPPKFGTAELQFHGLFKFYEAPMLIEKMSNSIG